MAGLLTADLAYECNNLVLANSGVDGSGTSRATATVYSKADLDPANTGDPIRFVDSGLTFSGQTINIGDLTTLNSHRCTNYPSGLSDVGNKRYDGQGFVGYISSVSPTTRDGASAVRLEISDERWKWNRYTLPTLLVNQGQKPGANDDGAPSRSGSAQDKEMTVHEILDFVETWVKNFHNDFVFDYDRLPDKQIGEVTIQGNAYSFVIGLIRQFYGTKYQIYSAGAGHLEVVKVETCQSELAQFRVDRNNLIDNNMTIISDPEEDIDVLLAIGADRQYYVGDGEYDNELVPDWDWWNDGRLLIISTNTYSPAFYTDDEGQSQLVNPFNFGVDITDPENPKFLGPNATPSSNVLVFVESFDEYPTYTDFMRRMNNPSETSSPEITRYAVGTTYGFDALRRLGALKEAIHNGRFRRFRLKDYKWREFLLEVSPGVFQRAVYNDQQRYPSAKPKPGDPKNLNQRVLQREQDVHDPIVFDRYRVQDKENYSGYKVIIIEEFINNSAHEIKKMRAKPGKYLSGVDNPLDIEDQFLPQVNENDPTEIKEGSAMGPIVVKYDLVSSLTRTDGSAVFAERVLAGNFQIVNGNKILFDEPQIVTSGTISQANLKAAVDQGMLDEADAYNVFFDRNVYRNDGTQSGKYWYYFLQNGARDAKFPTVRKQTMYDRNADQVTEDGTDVVREKWIAEWSEFPIAIPRVEIFCFVQYVDFPERETSRTLSDLQSSAYWTKIKTLFQYPTDIVNISKKKVSIEYRDDLVYQEGGIYEYTGDQVKDEGKYEVISYYDDTGIDKAFEDFDSGDQHTGGFGQKKTVVAFQLRNDTVKFLRDAADKVKDVVPKGTASYHDRLDIRPEYNGSDVMISNVSFSFGKGWNTTISYGGPAPTIRKLYDEDQRLDAKVFNVMDNLSNKTAARLNVTPTQAKRTT